MRPQRQSAPTELVVERRAAVLEPGAFDLHAKVLEADLQELLVRQRGPGEFLAHPCANLQTEGADGVTAGVGRQPPDPLWQAPGCAIFLARACLLW